MQAAKQLNNIPYKYITIAGKSFEETLSIMRRWIVKEVGFDENGRTNPCMIIYDYLWFIIINDDSWCIMMIYDD